VVLEAHSDEGSIPSASTLGQSIKIERRPIGRRSFISWRGNCSTPAYSGGDAHPNRVLTVARLERRGYRIVPLPGGPAAVLAAAPVKVRLEAQRVLAARRTA